MFEIKKYSIEYKEIWNELVKNSKNGTFLFHRDYMDYHADRFTDYSLIVFRKGKPYTLFPANRVENIIYSHQGLTYGGFIMTDKVTISEMLEVIQIIHKLFKKEGINKVVYKAIPYIYHKQPSQEDLYALFKYYPPRITGRNISSAIYQKNKIRFTESRKSGIRKASSEGLTITESLDFAAFWGILENNLNEKYHTKPVHSLPEMLLLHTRFPQNIKLYLVCMGKIPVAGTVLYLTDEVVHTQYISATSTGKKSGALDLLFDYLINKKYTDYQVFDFGQSTERMGTYLNESLIFQKEGFGARGVLYDIYEYEL